MRRERRTRRQGTRGVIENKEKTSLSKKKEAEVLAMLARLHAGLGELAESEANFDASLGRNPRSHGTWLSLGQLFAATGRDDLALRAYARVVEICDEDDDGNDDARTVGKNDGGGRSDGGGDETVPTRGRDVVRREDEYIAEERRARGEARAEAVLLSGAVYERHGQPHRALKSYELLTGDSHRDIREARELAVLTRCALKVQRVFRGNKAREEARRRATARTVARHYGARGPLRGGDGAGGGVLSESTGEVTCSDGTRRRWRSRRRVIRSSRRREATQAPGFLVLLAHPAYNRDFDGCLNRPRLPRL